MTSLVITSKFEPVAHFFARGLASAVQRIQRLSRAWKHRRAAASLAVLDDRMLADIGLSRGDVQDAFSEPVWSDPTAILVSRVHERRANRRRSVGFDGNLMTAPPLVPSVPGQRAPGQNLA
jgi:uncharacterized protein YjiS (DUF1127 family)